MSLVVLDPVGETRQFGEGKPMRSLESLDGKRLGLLWGGHVASSKFWPALEEAVIAKFRPSEVHRLYKSSSWNEAPAADVEEFARKVDYAIVGVAA